MRRIGILKHTFENGRMETVEDDVLNIVRQIREISPRVTVYWNDHIGKFTLTETTLDGAEERLVFNADVLDERVLDRLRLADQWRGREDPEHVLSDSEDVLAQVEQAQSILDAAKDAAFSEKREELRERFAAYADLDGKGIRAQILVPRSLDG